MMESGATHTLITLQSWIDFTHVLTAQHKVISPAVRMALGAKENRHPRASIRLH